MYYGNSVEIVTVCISDVPRSVSKEELRTNWRIQWRELYEEMHVKLYWHWYYTCVTGILLICFSLERPGAILIPHEAPVTTSLTFILVSALAQPVTSYKAMCLAHTFATSVMILPMASPFKDSAPWADARRLTLHQGQLPFMFPSCIERPFGEFSSGPVVKTPPCHCRGRGFYPCLGKLRSHMLYSQKVK